MKRKIIVSSVLTILLCLSIIAGSTFALFTSRSDVNIAITAGKVELVATIDQASLKLYTQMTDDPTVNEYGPESVFENGGTATVNADGELVIERMTPADKVVFDVVMENNSDVNIQYRVTWATESKLAQVLDVYASEVDSAKDVTTWTEWKAPADNAQKYKRTTVTVHLPSEVGNDYQTAEAKIVISVEAVQGNGVTAVSNVAGLADALAKAAPGSSIQLDGVDFGTITLNSELKDVTLVGSANTKAMFEIVAPAVLDNVTFSGFNFEEYAAPGLYEGVVNIRAGAVADVTFENCVFAPDSNGPKAAGVRSYDASSEIEFKNCIFDGNQYAFYKSGDPIAELIMDNCIVRNNTSWVTQTHWGTEPNVIIITNNKFEGCVGMFKITGAYVDGSEITFANNTIVNSQPKSGKWFEVNVTNAAVADFSGNTLDGVAWEIGAAEGVTK